jgi:tetratricopeptide (TPR) repeat protein
MRRTILSVSIAIPLICLLALVVYFLPPVHARLAWRVDELWLRLKYTLNPPEEVLFVPQPQARTATPQSTATPTLPPALTSTAQAPHGTPIPSPSPTITGTPLPDQARLAGVKHQNQHGRYNYCAPANLAMALSYWGWKGDQDLVGPVIKPDPKDKNVMPYEMVDYIEQQTDLDVALRYGGDLDLLKRFIASGFPVLIEKGTYLTDMTGVKSWMGHFQVITGYDDNQDMFIAQDSFVGPDFEVSYEALLEGWRAFDYVYLVVHPPEQHDQVMALLGPEADETANIQQAATRASNEIYGLAGIDQYFAWYNRGTNLMLLQDYAGAAEAYDQAFAVYPSIPEAERPWRMLWYQTGPYFSYYHSGRYWDVLNLAETYYWRGMAKNALGDTSGAIYDFWASLKYHPGFEPAIYQLKLLGIEAS